MTENLFSVLQISDKGPTTLKMTKNPPNPLKEKDSKNTNKKAQNVRNPLTRQAHGPSTCNKITLKKLTKDRSNALKIFPYKHWLLQTPSS